MRVELKRVAFFGLILGITAECALAIAETSSAQEDSSPIEFNGYLDFYYQVSPEAHTAVMTPPPSSGPRVVEGRAFDRLNNQLTLNMVELSAKKKTGHVAFRLDAAFGEMVDVLANNGPTAGAMGSNSPNPAASEPTRNITQATISYAPIENLLITIGKFYTHMGYEVTKAKDNWQYSRSYTFNYAIPFWHQGLNVNYGIIPGKLATTVHIVNGVDGRISQGSNKSPSAGANLNFVPTDSLTLNYNFMTDPEAGAGNGRREMHEVNAAYRMTSEVSLATDYVRGTQKSVAGGADASWSGLAFYVRAQLSKIYSLSPRIEFYDDSDGGFTTGVRQRLTAITITNVFDLGHALEGRLEFRSDKSDSSGYFLTDNGTATDRQDSYTAALLYSF